jgi:hypothetical protein
VKQHLEINKQSASTRREGVKMSIYPEQSTIVTRPIFMKLTLVPQSFLKTSRAKFAFSYGE